MEFVDFIKLPDKERIFLINCKLAKEIQLLSWTATGSGSYWCSFTWGEVVTVREMLDSSGAITAYAEVGSSALCDSITSSFYYDHADGKLYVHPSGNDPPDTADKYTILAYLFIGISNEPVVYGIEEEIPVDHTLVGYWPFNEGAGMVAHDKSQYGNDGDLINMEEEDWVDGKVGKALKFDGVDEYINLPDDLGYTTQVSAFAWFKRQGVPAGGYHIIFGGGELEISVPDPNGALRTGITTTDNRFVSNHGSGLVDGEWHYIGFTFDGSVKKSYIDGEFVGELAGITGDLIYSFLNRRMGRHGSSAVYYLNGIIDEVRIYNRTLTENEIKALFDNKITRHAMQYLPYFDVSKMPILTQAVGDYYIGSMKTQFGSLSFLNDGWWYTALENFIWHNKEVDILCGKKDSDYDKFGHIFAGKIRDPDVGDENCVIGIKDRRVGIFRQIPKDKYWKTTGGGEMDDLEDLAQGRPIGIPFGQLTNITPVFIKTDSSSYWRYKISKYAIESIDAVYLDGVAVDAGDITKVPASGYFDLNFDPGDGHVTCDVKGVKCDIDDDTYSEYVTDILWFVLSQENGFGWEKLDKVSFDDLKERDQKIAWYLDESISTLNFIRFLQTGSVFQFVPKSDGVYGAYHYKSGVPDDVPRLYTEDYDSLKKVEQTGAVYKKVVIKYAKDPTTGSWKSVEESDERVSHRHDEEKTLTIETALRDKAEAESLASFYLSLVRAPLAKLVGKITSVALGFKPSDKIVVSKQVTGGEGEKIEVFGESPNYAEVYRILELRKDLRSAKVGIIALEDDQSIGGDHANVAHEDTHSDTHGDTAHENSHADTDHANVAHEDSHENVPYTDAYTDHNDLIPE